MKSITKLRNYHAFEIDKYAEAVSRFNYPDIIRHGDVNNVDLVCSNVTPHERNIPTLLMGGSPCQDFSFAGHQKGFKGDRGALFFQFVDAMNILKPTYFLLENVMMTQKNQDIMSKYLGVKPVMINSQDFSAHHRKRLYFTNIPILPYVDKGVVLSNIIEDGMVDREKSYCVDANYFKGGSMKMYYEKSRRQLVFGTQGCHQVGEADLKGYDIIKRVYDTSGKSPALTTMQGGWRQPKIATDELHWRNLTPLECERLQTVPDNYTQYGEFEEGGPFKRLSNTQRYKMLGNGWTVDVIAHILKGMELKDELNVWSLFDGMSCGRLAIDKVLESTNSLNNYKHMYG